MWSTQPSQATERSTSVVTPESSNSEKQTVAQCGMPSASQRKSGMNS